MGGSNHTHYKIYHTSYSEQRTGTVGSNGQKVYKDWKIIPGSENTRFIGEYEESGWTNGYEKEI